MRIIIILYSLLFVNGLFAQSSAWIGANPENFVKHINQEDLKTHLFTLASSEMEGRETGKPGQKKAADYISSVFKNYGLPAIGDQGTYFQKVTYRTENWEKISLGINGETFRSVKDFYAIPYYNTNLDSFATNEIVFLGYGIDDERYSDYENADVKNKVILIYDGEPIDKDGNSFVTGTSDTSDWTKNWKKKLQVAKAKGVKAVLFIDSDFQENLLKNAQQSLSGYEVQFTDAQIEKEVANSVFLSSTLAKKIVGNQFNSLVKARKKIIRKGKAESVSIACDFGLQLRKNVRSLEGENVLGYIEGVDEQLKDELVVITAHYDHLGKRGESIYFGADDNASGTSTVLEICQAFQEAKKIGQGPRRSVLVMLVSGEEKGLLGSKFYAENPVFPIENTIANVNVDMVGRTDEKHAGNPDYIYVIGADRLSSELHQINENANTTHTQLELDYTYNLESDPNRYYYRSDHYNFAEKGVPAIFYFSGTHTDYHRTSDTPEKIDLKKMEKIGKLVFYTSWGLANRDERIKVDKK
ncbi:MAG: M28 family peptidase [Saprospiraceae bacterium]|nr:M28 family peptidase [Saprospiraceae bacterium]